jgi:hypothetical protein
VRQGERSDGLYGRVLQRRKTGDGPVQNRGRVEIFSGGHGCVHQGDEDTPAERAVGPFQRDTAVSAEVAEAMAKGAIRRFNADLGVSITGVAGPEPDEDGNPVGLVYCAVARSETTQFVELRCKSAKPDEIIDEAAPKH